MKSEECRSGAEIPPLCNDVAGKSEECRSGAEIPPSCNDVAGKSEEIKDLQTLAIEAGKP